MSRKLIQDGAQLEGYEEGAWAMEIECLCERSVQTHVFPGTWKQERLMMFVPRREIMTNLNIS